MELTQASRTYTDFFGISRCIKVKPLEQPSVLSLVRIAHENEAWAGDTEETLYLIHFCPGRQELFTEQDIRNKLRERKQRRRGRNATIHA